MGKFRNNVLAPTASVIPQLDQTLNLFDASGHRGSKGHVVDL